MSPFVDAALGAIPVWLIITLLVGVVNGSLFFLIVGRRPSSLVLYVALAAGAASLAQASGLFVPGSPPYSVGDVQLVWASLVAWAALALTRAVGL